MKRSAPEPDAPPKVGEHDAARRLADALAGGAEAGVDEEALAAAHLLSAVAAAGIDDEVAAARTRRRLVAAAARRGGRRWLRLAGGVAAVLAIGAGAALWLSARREPVDLSAKEAEARAAVALACGDVAVANRVSALHSSLSDTRWDKAYSELEADRFDRLRRLQTTVSLEEPSTDLERKPASEPTPGGVS